jgi:hypothetical protein
MRPLNLRERQTVRLQLLPDELSEEEDEGETAIRILVSAGLMRPPQRGTPPDPVSEEQRRALAERLAEGPGKPLSELIIEDRGEL